MLGKINLIPFDEMILKDKMPQRVASAWAAVQGLIGANYTPLLYCGDQTVKGVNHWFIAGITRTTNPISRAVITVAVNEFAGEYTLVHGSDMTIFE